MVSVQWSAGPRAETGWQRAIAEEKVFKPWWLESRQTREALGTRILPSRSHPQWLTSKQTPHPKSTFSYWTHQCMNLLQSTVPPWSSHLLCTWEFGGTLDLNHNRWPLVFTCENLWELSSILWNNEAKLCSKVFGMKVGKQNQVCCVATLVKVIQLFVLGIGQGMGENGQVWERLGEYSACRVLKWSDSQA